MAFTPSLYQTAIYDYIKGGKGNLVIRAVAGGSKTTTSIESLKYVPATAKCVFLAFNKSIAQTLEARVPRNVKASTFHSYGMSILKRLMPHATLEADKIRNTVEELADANDWSVPEERVAFFNRIEKLVNLMRLTLNEDLDLLCDIYDIQNEDSESEYATQVLAAANANDTQFDFTDMIYVPATREFKSPAFDYVYVDEFQDCCEAQYRFLCKLLGPTGRLICVGDPNQSIYSHIGADPALFSEALARPNTVELPLSISYRCSKAVVAHAKKLVPEIEAAADAPEGRVVMDGSIANVRDADFVLCRTNMPLVKLALEMIREGQKAVVRGKDIGRNLVTFLKPYARLDVAEMRERLDQKRARLVTKLLKRYPDRELDGHKEYNALMDKLTTVEVLSDDVDTVAEVVSRIERLFSDDMTQGVVLSTVHKAKGLEAERVFIIEPQLIPWPKAEKDWEKQQERNVDYVARTRAISHLEYVRDWTVYRKRVGNESMLAQAKAAAARGSALTV